MPKQLSLQTLLDAIKALGIDVPIMRAEQDDNGAITIFLYGGETRHWPPQAVAEIPAQQPFDYARPPVTRSELAKSKKSGRPKKS